MWNSFHCSHAIWKPSLHHAINVKSQASWGAVLFIYLMVSKQVLCRWWVVRQYHHRRYTNTGLTQEAVIFQRYFVLQRSPQAVAFFTSEIPDSLWRCITPLPFQGRLYQLVRDAFPSPIIPHVSIAEWDPRVWQTPSILCFPYRPWWFPTASIHTPFHYMWMLMWMTREPGPLHQLQCAKESLGAASATLLQQCFLQGLS